MTFPNDTIICRVCKGDSTVMTSIYTSLSFAERIIEIQEVMKTCASVQIEESDGLPAHICSKCVVDLRVAYSFKTLCEKSDNELRLNLKWMEIRTDSVSIQGSQERKKDAVNDLLANNCVSSMNFNELKEKFFVKTPILPAGTTRLEYDFFADDNKPNYNRIRTYQAKTAKAATQVKPSEDCATSEAKLCSQSQGDANNVFDRVDIKEEIKVEPEENAENQIDASDAVPSIQPISISEEVFLLPTGNLNNNCDKTTETPIKIENEELIDCNGESDNDYNEDTNSDDSNEFESETLELCGHNRNITECLDCCKTLTLRNLLQGNPNLHLKPKKPRKILRCRFCDEILPDKRSLTSHQKLHTKIHSCSCGKAFRSFSRFLDHKKLHKRRFKCEICNASYLSKSRLKIHIRTHTGDTPFVCDVCNKGFIRSYSLRIHKMEHTGEKPFECQLCPKRFTQRSLLKKHEKTHSGEKPFECELCRMRFSRNFHLQRHILKHSGHKPDVSEMKFQCEFCGKKFFEKRHLRSHRVVHTGERPFKCDVCGKDFAQSSTLSTHKRVHTGEKRYKCDICNKRYSQKGYLTGHMRIHTGEKPYKCDVCGKFFRLPGHLSTHMKSHSGEKPYQCEVCEKKFTLPSHLRVHKLIHDREAAARPKE